MDGSFDFSGECKQFENQMLKLELLFAIGENLLYNSTVKQTRIL